MSSSPRPANSSPAGNLLWITALAISVIFLIGLDGARMKRVAHVTQAAQSEEPVMDATSATGYAHNKRWLIVPEHHNPTYQWIQETQQMFARGEWRVRHIDYENAPQGREVHTASPYHWWIAALAWSHHLLSGKPLGWCVEQSALWSDPLLHLLLLVSGIFFIAGLFGTKSAIFAALGLTTFYPFSASFLPGVLNDYNLSQVIVFWCVLLAVTGFRDEGRANRWWLLSGLAAGCGLWISATTLWPVLTGISLGGILASVARAWDKAGTRNPIPWRLWGLGAAVASAVGYLVEYYPSGMALRLEVNHPLYALACLGTAELLSCIELWAQRRKFPSDVRTIVGTCVGLLAIAALPCAMSWKQMSLPPDLFAKQLTNEPDGAVATNIASWLTQAGASKLALAATLLPLFLLVPAILVLVRQPKDRSAIPTLGLVLGLTGVTVALAFAELRWWSLAGAMLLLLGLILTNVKSVQALVFGAAGLASFCGLIQLVHAYHSVDKDASTHHEVEQIYERKLAHWIADHAGPEGALVLAPPFRTPSFTFYGSLRGLGTQNWENRDGLGVTLRITNNTEPGVAQMLLNQRGVTHIILPSWDRDLSEVARLSIPDETRSFVYQLENWTVYDWIRPLPFRLPEIGGLTEPVVKVLQVTEGSNRAIAISRVTEYFLEMEHLEQAQLGLTALRQFPSDLGALITIAQVEKARGDEPAFQQAFDSLVANLTAGSGRFLPWNRRINLAVILTLGGRKDLAQPQVERCWKEITATRLQSLTTGELYRLLVLAKSYRLQFSDPELQALTQRLLPPELRERFQSM
jgi:hypothetical protein